MIIKLTVSKKIKDYDLSNPKEFIALKKIISRAITNKNIRLLDEVQRQLQLEPDGPNAAEILILIQRILSEKQDLISDVTLFPRSEYYTRFQGTTFFDMCDPYYWVAYHRSESSRFFSVSGGRKAVQFKSPCVAYTKGVNSFFAHTGGFSSPFSAAKYREKITMNKQISPTDINIRDELLLYKNYIAREIITIFETFQSNQQKIRKKGTKKQYDLRPIVNVENNYPCILVKLPVINPLETPSDAAKYWEIHPAAFQRLLQCSFVALLNVEAMKENIPIEIVLRSSFSHILPSVCETHDTFRINIGIIPKNYATLIAKSLYLLNKIVSSLTDETSISAPFSIKFLAKVRVYNAQKLKAIIQKNSRYKPLINTKNFKKSESSDKYLDALYQDFNNANEGKPAKGSSTCIRVNLKNKTIWQVIREAGDSMGKSVLDECFRRRGTEDWFINRIMEAILISEAKYARKAIKHNPIELALDELLGFLVYDSKVSMNYEKIHYELKRAKLKFQMPSFSNLYATDKEFSDITQKLCDAFLIEKPSKDLYAILEKSGIDMLTTHRVSKKISKTSDYGSDSEFSYDDISNDGVASRAFFHKKLRVCSGMKAIMLAQYTALHYLRSKYAKEVQCHYGSDASQMYYEVPDALNLVSSPDKMLEDKIRSNENILLFDLNHCNASNTSQNSTTLSTKLNNDEKISIAILDYTSSTVLQIEQSIQLCFKKPKIELIMLVESGLKNSQGGIDLNPYGEFRIFCRTKKMLDQVFDIAKLGLSEKDKLSGITHEMVRVCKARGMEMSLLGHFKSSSKRFASIDPNTPIINNGIN